jgi:hypothetical protein
MNIYKLVEKKDPLRVHGIFSSLQTANRHLIEAIPVYVAKGYFKDRTLKPNDFTIITDNMDINS